MKFRIFFIYLICIYSGCLLSQSINRDLYITSDVNKIDSVIKENKSVLIKVSRNRGMLADDVSVHLYNTYNAIIISPNNDRVIASVNKFCNNQLIEGSEYLISLRVNKIDTSLKYDVVELDNNYLTKQAVGNSCLKDRLLEFIFSSYDIFNSFIPLPSKEIVSYDYHNNIPHPQYKNIFNNVIEVSDEEKILCINGKELLTITAEDPITPPFNYKGYNLKFSKKSELFTHLKEIKITFRAFDGNKHQSKELLIFPKDLEYYISSEELDIEDKAVHITFVRFQFEFDNQCFNYLFTSPFMRNSLRNDFSLSTCDFWKKLKHNKEGFINPKILAKLNNFNFAAKDSSYFEDVYNGTNYNRDADYEDFDQDGIVDYIDCNFTNSDITASRDTDGDGVCDDKDQCIDQFGSLKNNGCPSRKTDLLSDTENQTELMDSINDPFIYSTKGISISSKKKLYEECDSLVSYINLVRTQLDIDSINASIMFLDNIVETIQNSKKEFINSSKVNSFRQYIDRYKGNLKTDYAIKMDSIHKLLLKYDNIQIQIQSDSKIIDDCLDLVPLYLDSISLRPNDTLYNSILIEMLDAMLQVLSKDDFVFTNNKLNDKLLISKFLYKHYLNNSIKGYLLPTICYETKERKRYSKNAKAFYYNGNYGKRHDIKHLFKYGTNPHYELFSVGNYFISYVVNDTINLKDYFELKTYDDPLYDKVVMREQSINASQDKYGWKAIVILEFLDHKIMDGNKPLPGLTQYDESNLINALDEINKKQNKYFLVKGKIFYEHEK